LVNFSVKIKSGFGESQKYLFLIIDSVSEKRDAEGKGKFSARAGSEPEAGSKNQINDMLFAIFQ
jgi:hypothetical protein